MDEKLFPAMFGDKVTVEIPRGLPALMMNVVRELLRDPPETERDAYSFLANYLERLLNDERGKDDLIDMVTNLNKTDEERYIEKLIGSGYTIEHLDKLATSIQRWWKRYIRLAKLCRKPAKDIFTIDSKVLVDMESNVWTHEMVTEDLIKMVDNYGVTLMSGNEAAIIIQRTWRKYRKSVLQKKSSTSIVHTRIISPIQFKIESLDEFDFENDSDDMERINVVKKGQRDYVPPIPDFINDMDSLNNQSMINIIDRLREISNDDETVDEDY